MFTLWRLEQEHLQGTSFLLPQCLAVLHIPTPHSLDCQQVWLSRPAKPHRHSVHLAPDTPPSRIVTKITECPRQCPPPGLPLLSHHIPALHWPPKRIHPRQGPDAAPSVASLSSLFPSPGPDISLSLVPNPFHAVSQTSTMMADISCQRDRL